MIKTSTQTISDNTETHYLAGEIDTSADGTPIVQCIICQKWFAIEQVQPVKAVRKEIRSLIKVQGLHPQAAICNQDLTAYRIEYISKMMKQEKGKLANMQQEVVDSIEKSEILSNNSDALFDEELGLGQKLADGIARFGGSWKFIISFLLVLGSWIVINAIHAFGVSYDPYPFILLNLVLSCLAALQAPVIMMSQNRQEMKDRLRGENDYKVNLKSEIEVRTLHEKIDHLLVDQWEKMGQIQQLQMEMLGEIKQEIHKLKQVSDKKATDT